MRTIFRLCLVAAMVAALGLVAVPAASAQISDFERDQNQDIRKAKKKAKKANRKANRAHNRLDGVDTTNNNQNDTLSDHGARLDSAESTLGTILAAAGDIIDGLEALQAGLTAVNDALQDPVTGLVGLNNARPQFGVFEADGNFLGGTGTAGEGPAGDATQVGAGTYVVNFSRGNDVSDRVYSLNVFPTGGVGLTASAINCEPGSADAGIDAACGSVDNDNTRYNQFVFVLFQDSTTGAPTDPANGWSLTAISG